MAVTILNTIKSWFLTGAKPTQAQFWDAWDSFRHKNDSVPVAEVSGLDALLLAKASQAVVDAQAILIGLKENTANKGVADGYAPLNELAKIAAVYLTIVDDLTTGGSTALASAETVKQLKLLIDGINVILGSDNVDLNNVQELVDAIETIQTSLSTILVNDLTTGGTTKALTAEQGRVLKGLIDDFEVLPPTLQEVLDRVFGEDQRGQASRGLYSYLSLLQEDQDGNASSDFRMSNAAFTRYCYLWLYHNQAGFLGIYDDLYADFKIVDGLASVRQKIGLNETIVDFTTPVANTNIKYPAKPAGTYTLATTEDAIATIQSLMGQRAFLDDVFNGVYGSDGTDIDFFTGGPFARNFRIQVANPNDSGRRNGLQLNNYKAEFTGVFEGVWSVVGINNGRVLLSEFCEYENPVTGSLTEVTMELRFERPTSNSNIRIPAPPIDGTYKAALVGVLAPTTATSPGTLGEIRYDANYAYFCVATDTWKRTALTTW